MTRCIFPLAGFTGIDQAYEAPERPELVLPTGTEAIDTCVQQCVTVLEKAGIVPKSAIGNVEVCPGRRAVGDKLPRGYHLV